MSEPDKINWWKSVSNEIQPWHQKTMDFVWLVSLDEEKHLAQRCISTREGSPDIWYLIPQLLESHKQ